MPLPKPPLHDQAVAVRTTGLTRRYGLKLAVNQLDIEIARGDICGFIGPNGAGKTTTLRMLATLLAPTSGVAKIFGYHVVREADQVRHLIGYMPDHFGLYRDMVAGEYLDFFAAAYSIPSQDRKKIVGDVLALTDLTEKRDEPIASLSRGMQQRLSLARVLLHDPELLLLDEPASGLDPRARIEIRALLTELQKMNKTIFISSHILTELAEMCNKVVIIEQGAVLFSGSLDALQKKIAPQRMVHVVVRDRAEDAVALLRERPEVSGAAVHGGTIEATLSPEAADPSVIARILVEGGFDILSLSPSEAKLEEAFMKITEGKVS